MATEVLPTKVLPTKVPTTEVLPTEVSTATKDTHIKVEPAPVVEVASRDRFIEASADIMLHLTDKIIALTRKVEFQERIQTILDPVVNHVINRVFPYIILSSILFLILLLVTVSTFIIVVRGSLLAIRSVDMAMKTGVPDNW
jgi:hypothetical protein